MFFEEGENSLLFKLRQSLEPGPLLLLRGLLGLLALPRLQGLHSGSSVDSQWPCAERASFCPSRPGNVAIKNLMISYE